MKPDESAPSSLVDMAVLGQLLEEHRPRLLAMVQRRLDTALAARVDAEEIVNEGFFLARRKWPRFKDQTTLSAFAWLYGIVRDCLIEVWRRTSRRAGLYEGRSLGHALGLGQDRPWTTAKGAAVGTRHVGDTALLLCRMISWLMRSSWTVK